MSRWLPDEHDSRRVRVMGRLMVFGAALLLASLLLLFLGQACGQGAPQPVPIPEEHRLQLLGGTVPRGAAITVWTQAGHEFTGRLQAVGDTVVIERGKDCVRIRQSWIYAVSAGGGR